MVVGGAPTKTPFHAEFVLDCLMAMVENVKDMKEPASQKEIKIRAGQLSIFAQMGNTVTAR